MELKIEVQKIKEATLGTIKPGESKIFCFADSADTPEGFFEALQDFGKYFFMPFVPLDGGKSGYIDVVSLDGKQMLRRPADRNVKMAPFGAEIFTWIADHAKSRASNVECGKIIIYPAPRSKLDDDLFLHVTDAVNFKVEGNPTPAGKVILISLLTGVQKVIDDDVLVPTGTGHFALNLKRM